MPASWTLAELVAAAAERIAALPPPKNGQVRAVPDERTVRYYGTLGLVDKPALEGRTAIYGPRQLAQVIAIKRLQSAGRSLSEIQALWSTLDDAALQRMSGVEVTRAAPAPARKEFWRRAPQAAMTDEPARRTSAIVDDPARTYTAVVDRAGAPVVGRVVPIQPAPDVAPVEVRIPLAPGVVIVVTPSGDGALALSSADVAAIRAAAAPLVTELARRQLTPHAEEETP